MNNTASLPSGTLTFLFTDIEGSTRLLQKLGDDYAVLLADQRIILRTVFDKYSGREVDTQGDAFFVSFPRASEAVAAAVEAQQALAEHPWAQGVAVRVRMSLHTGEPLLAEEGYVGMDVHRAARIAHIGHGGQVLLSLTTSELVRDDLPQGVSLRDLGEHRLKDLGRPERIAQLVIPHLPAEFSPLKSLDAQINNLPVQPTPFFGRERDLQKTRALILEQDTRLLTLTGPGGMGKTRLGLQLAAEMVDDFPDGVFFVPLAPVTDLNLVIGTVAHSLGLQEQGNRSLRQRLYEELKEKQLLLLLDNFEQVVDSAPEIADLLECSPGIKVIVTSREVLRLRAEKEYPVQPLVSPDASQLLSVATLSNNTAIRLFVTRAQAVRPGFNLTEENASAIAELCSYLDGLPLAIELAAARVKLLTPQAMLSRLRESNGRQSLRLLASGTRDAPERHRTMQATIDWSYNLLPVEVQTLFRRLSIFTGGFNLMAAEEICDPPSKHNTALAPLNVTVIDGVASLLDKSLLRQEGQVDTEPRFVMLEMIRDFALDRLDAREETLKLGRSHAVYFQRFAEAAQPELEKESQANWLARLEADHANFREALRWSIRQEDWDLASGLGIPLGIFWFMRGYLTEGRRWLEQILALKGLSQDQKVNADVLDRAGFLASYQGDYPTAARLIDDCLSLRRVLGDRHRIGDSLALLGFVRLRQGKYEEASILNQEALQIHREINNGQGIADALSNLGIIAFHRGDLISAQAMFSECLEIWEKLGDQQGVAWASHLLGKGYIQLRAYQKAQANFLQSLKLAIKLGYQWGLAFSLEGLASLASARARWVRALVLAGGAALIRHSIGMPLTAADQWTYDETLQAAYKNLTEEESTAAYLKGQSTPQHRLLQFAMEIDTNDRSEIKPA